ncbi:MAG TPA: LysR family substrate-binding domain-containing protein [Nocardioidaceae bacterium]
MTDDRPDQHPARLRVAFVPGVTPDKWARIWTERMPRVRLDLSPVEEAQQTAVLYDGSADMSFVRLPVDQEGLHVIPLYSEVPVVVAPKEHFVEAADEVSIQDLADEHLLQHPDQVPEWRDVATEVRDGTRVEVPPITVKQAIETVAAGVGIVIVPMSVARLHHRKDVVHRPVTDVAESRIGLAWRRDLDDDRVETFIGIVRGRSANSSRGRTDPVRQARAQSKPRRRQRPHRGR